MIVGWKILFFAVIEFTFPVVHRDIHSSIILKFV